MGSLLTIDSHPPLSVAQSKQKNQYLLIDTNALKLLEHVLRGALCLFLCEDGRFLSANCGVDLKMGLIQWKGSLAAWIFPIF